MSAIKRKAISSSLMLLFTAGIGLPAKTTQASLVCKQPGFAEPVALAATGTVPIAVAPGDFDLDGKPDLAVANQTSNTVGLLFGDGAGEFAALDPGLGVSNPVAVTVGNFDDSTEDDASNPDPNNSPDVAVMSGDSTLSLFFSHGNRAFSSRIIGNLDNMAGGNNALGMAQGDFNGDGHLDLAVTVAPNPSLPSEQQLQGVMILSGNGLKSFTPSFYRTDFVPLQFLASRSIGVGDFNRDGRPDLALAGANATVLGILFNDGLGGFNAQKINFNRIEAVTVNDFNGDGYPDVAVTGHDYQGILEASVSILLNNQNQTFARSDISVAAWRSAPFTIVSGDFNFDHNPDLVVGGSEVTDPYAGYLTVLLGDGTGKFGDIASVRAGLKAYSLAVGDFNGDGQADVVEADRSSQVTLLPGGGAVGFRLSENFSVGRSGSNAADETPQSIASGDLDGDGFLDLVTANWNYDDTISVLFNDRSGNFPIPQLYGAGNTFEQPWSVALSDFNQDGQLDVAALTKATNQVKVLPGAGISGLGAAVAFAVGTAPVSEAAGDFNGDGRPDLAVANSGSDNVSVLLGDGTGGFASTTDFATGVTPVSVIAADVNGDGYLDLAIANRVSDTVSVLLGDGAGSFGTAANFGVGDQPFSLTSGDFNEDGKLDLATASDVVGTVSLLQGDGTGVFARAGGDLPVGVTPRSVQAGDFDMDGHADLAVANFGSGDASDLGSNNVRVLLGDGKGGFAQPVNFAVGSNESLSRPVSMTVGDFDRTGSLDLATALSSQRAVSVLSNCAASPVTTIHADPAAPNSQGWYTSPVKFHTSAVDSTGNADGITETRCTIMAPPTGETVNFNALPPGNDCAAGLTTAAEGTNSFHAASKDTDGSVETVQQATVKIDTTPPTIAGSRTPEANGNGWNNSPVTVGFSCNDSVSGIASCPSGQAFSVEGANQSASGEATDKAGNSANTTVGGINIDTTPPTIVGSRNPAVNGSGWNNSDVTVGFTCNDNLSGIASCSPGQAFSAEGADQASGTAMDNAGNSAETTVGINIDKTAPTTVCSVASPGPVFTLGGAGVVDATVADALSGHAVSPVWTSANAASVGNKTVSLIGADRADNTQAATCPYRVKYGFSGFQGINSTYRSGSRIPVVFKLTYANGSWLSPTEAGGLAAGCLVKVGLDAASVCATYNSRKDVFTASIKAGANLGAHLIVADVFAPNGSGLVNHETSPVSIRK